MYHKEYMQRCLELASRGCSHVAPNPMVGAVIVHNDIIIGEGYHRQYGGAHAEPNAIASVKDTGLLQEATLYVNLEPCSHYGKTPPCAQLIIDKKISRVVVGGLDPFPEVAGRGVEMLRRAGVEVVVDVLKGECENLNKRFLTFHRYCRPYIILKWAQSADGYIDRFREVGDKQKAVVFSSGATRLLSHKLRSEEVAILVGTKTALLDNPSLTVRHWFGQSPLRILIDRNGTISATSHLLDGSVPTLVFTHLSQERELSAKVETALIDFTQDILPQMMSVLYQRNVQSLIVEGGSCLLDSFLSSGLWDEARVEVSSIRLTGGVKAPHLEEKPVHIYEYKNSRISSYTNRILPKIL